jgi:hypothetical protein
MLNVNSCYGKPRLIFGFRAGDKSEFAPALGVFRDHNPLNFLDSALNKFCLFHDFSGLLSDRRDVLIPLHTEGWILPNIITL